MNSASSNVYRGGLIIIGAMASIGLVDNFIRHVVAEASIWQFYLVRGIMAIGIMAIYCAWRGRSPIPRRMWAVAARSAASAAAILIYFGSLSVMRIAEAGATLFTSPIFVLLISALLFRMRVGPWRVAAVAIGFIGVLLVLKPEPGNLDVFVLIPLLAGILYALGQLATRHLCADEQTVAVLFGFFVVNVIYGIAGVAYMEFVGVDESLVQRAPFFFTGWSGLSADFMLWTTVQCIGSLIGVAGLIRGYQIADPTYIAVFEYSFVIFAGFWAWVLWNEIPDSASLAGIAMVIAAGIVITVRSRA